MKNWIIVYAVLDSMHLVVVDVIAPTLLEAINTSGVDPDVLVSVSCVNTQADVG